MEQSRRHFIVRAGGLSLAGPALGLIGQSGSASVADQGSGRRDGNSSSSTDPLAPALSVEGERAAGARGLTAAFEPVPLTRGDRVDTSPGFESRVLISMGDPINAAGDTFGDCCDFTAFLPGEKAEQAFLWVNHEYVHQEELYSRPVSGAEKTKQQVDVERGLVGGSFLELRIEKGRYVVNRSSTRAFRVDGTTPLPLVGPAGGEVATGTMGNCSGGLTPWGTILTAEENVEEYYDEDKEGFYGWSRYYPMKPEHYGYIVEIDPVARTGRKLTSLGRFAHEGACVHVSAKGHLVAYMGDDARFECLYKYVSRGKVSGDAQRDRDLLVDGDLFVANLSTGTWEMLGPEHPKLKDDAKKRFLTQRDICIDTRAAAHAAGGTPLNRPEGIVVDPASGVVLIALTNNSKAGDYYGSLLALREKDADHSGRAFESETVLTCGPRAGLACPDNLAMGPGGYLWVGMDISSEALGDGAYERFERNALHRIESDGGGDLRARRFLLAPPGAEVTGMSFAKDGKALFVSIQHPGEGKTRTGISSQWPHGTGRSLSSVVVCVPTTGRFS